MLIRMGRMGGSIGNICARDVLLIQNLPEKVGVYRTLVVKYLV